MASLAVAEDFRAVEMAWLGDHGNELAERYPGEWIAVDGSALIAHSADLPTLLEPARAAGHPDPLVTAVAAQPLGRFY